MRSGPDEFLRCEVPQRIAIVREIDGAWKTNRYLQFAGREFAKVLPGAGLQTAKNPEGVVSHGPLHAQNCTSGTGALQTVSFRVRSEGFFATGIGDHLAFGLRANYPAFNALGSEQYEGIGTILHPKAMPRMAEPAGIAHCPGGDRRRDSPYRPELRNSLHWRVLQLAAGRPP